MGNTEIATVSEKPIEVNHVKYNRLDDSLFSKDLSPHYMKLAGQLAASELLPKAFKGKPSDLFLCWAYGYQIGLTPEQSMQCIAIINGKPTLHGDEMLALCMSHKDFENILEEPIVDNNHVIIGYKCTVKRKGKADKCNIFTLDMAKKAGLLAKGGVWVQYTDRMLKLRARGFTLRDAFPDALKGIKSREEVEDYIDAEYITSQPKSSRTELLKQDYLNKKGVNNAEDEVACRSSMPEENYEDIEAVDEDNEPGKAQEVDQKAANLHLEIKRLIRESEFTEERLTKALTYYEVDCIESLSNESAQHFITQLNKT